MNPATVSIAAGIDETATVPSREWWRREAAREGSDWLTILSEYLALVGHLAGWPACDTCGGQPCVDQSFCAACRVADLEKARSIQRESPHRRTPPTTVEAILYSVRERGLKALQEPANIERLTRCDDAALAQIDARIAKLTRGRR
jgi:hypothetical protein